MAIAGSGGSGPVANDDSYIVAHDRPLAVPEPGVLAGDTDPLGRSLLQVLVYR